MPERMVFFSKFGLESLHNHRATTFSQSHLVVSSFLDILKVSIKIEQV